MGNPRGVAKIQPGRSVNIQWLNSCCAINDPIREKSRCIIRKILEECFTNMNEKHRKATMNTAAGEATCLVKGWFKPQGVCLVHHFEHIPRLDFRFTFTPFTGNNCMICGFDRIHGMVDLPTFTMKINSVIGKHTMSLFLSGWFAEDVFTFCRIRNPGTNAKHNDALFPYQLKYLESK